MPVFVDSAVIPVPTSVTVMFGSVWPTRVTWLSVVARRCAGLAVGGGQAEAGCAGGIVSSVKRIDRAETLPATSVATRLTVWGPSAVPSSARSVGKLKLPDGVERDRERSAAVDLADKRRDAGEIVGHNTAHDIGIGVAAVRGA